MYRNGRGERHLRARGSRITVVGAGPVGCYAAWLLAKTGFRVTVLEEHLAIGTPCHCTGIVTRDLAEILEVPPGLIANAISRVRVTAPDGGEAIVPSSDIVLDRVGFDRHLAARAQEAGVEIRLGRRFVGFGSPGRIRTTVAARGTETTGVELEEIPTDILVGADGPVSMVAKCAGLYGARSFYAGLQFRMVGHFAADIYDVHLVVPRFFGWVVPESSSVARVGVACRAAPRRELEALLRRLGDLGEPLDRQWGLIPIYDPALPVAARRGGIEVRLVGDAATMVKATTGGGLVPGLLAARALDASLATGASYVRCLAPIRRRLAAHLRIREMLNGFSDADYCRLVGLCAGERVSRVLAEGSRDRPLRLLWDLLRSDPRLAVFAGVAAARLWSAARRTEPGAATASYGDWPEGLSAPAGPAVVAPGSPPTRSRV